MRMLALALAALVLAAQAGCGRSPSFERLPPPPSEEVRARLGRIVVRSDNDLLAESVVAPAVASACSAAALGCLVGIGTGLGIAAGLWRGGGGVGSGGGTGAALVILVIVFIWAFITATAIAGGIVGGTLWGLSKSPSGKELERARQLIEKAILERRFADQIKASVVEKAARLTDARVAAWSPGGERDTILEISGPRVGLHGPWSFDARLRLTSEIQVRLIASADGTPLHSFRLRRIGGEKSFEEWVGTDGSAVAAELGNSEPFAERILEELFLLVELPDGASR